MLLAELLQLQHQQLNPGSRMDSARGILDTLSYSRPRGTVLSLYKDDWVDLSKGRTLVADHEVRALLVHRTFVMIRKHGLLQFMTQV